MLASVGKENREDALGDWELTPRGLPEPVEAGATGATGPGWPGATPAVEGPASPEAGGA